MTKLSFKNTGAQQEKNENKKRKQTHRDTQTHKNQKNLPAKLCCWDLPEQRWKHGTSGTAIIIPYTFVFQEVNVS